jgi:fumarylacetoacetase
MSEEPDLISFQDISPDSLFPLQNLPYGIFSTKDGRNPRAGVAVGEWVLDLAVLEARGAFAHIFPEAEIIFARPILNPFMALGRPVWKKVRETIQDLLAESNPTLRDDPLLRKLALIPRSEVQMHLPAQIGDYTDFYSSKYHAANVGSMFRDKHNPLLPNWTHLPVAYHGRASSVVLSGTDIYRPQGQIQREDDQAPIFAPTRELDFELELGFFIGPGNELGRPIPLEEAYDHIFGLVLVNDWSARDIQRWEYRPLGPFLAKNFATSISPWIVPIEALAAFRCPGPVQDPHPLPYLHSAGQRMFDIELQVSIQTPQIAQETILSRTNACHLYWDFGQQLAHHTVSGCNLRPGDLLATGTISGPDAGSYGSLLELTWGGVRPLPLPGAEQRTYLADGDKVTLRGWCQGDGYRVGFGEVTGVIVTAEKDN